MWDLWQAPLLPPGAEPEAKAGLPAKPEVPAGPWEVYTKWPFDSAEAKRRQTETAKALGVPVEKDIDRIAPQPGVVSAPGTRYGHLVAFVRSRLLALFFFVFAAFEELEMIQHVFLNAVEIAHDEREFGVLLAQIIQSVTYFGFSDLTVERC